MPVLTDYIASVKKRTGRGLTRLFYAFFTLVPSLVYAQTNEYQVKAVFVFNFTHFVKWPSHAFPDARAPFVIGVFGKELVSYLQEAVEGEKMEGHPLVVRSFENLKKMETCHIIFIEKRHASSIRKIIAELIDKPVLTVSDADNFMEDGGMIQLYDDNEKIRLEINPKKSEESSLTVSAKLLNLATIFKSND